MTIDELKLVLEQVDSQWANLELGCCHACGGDFTDDKLSPPFAATHTSDCRYVRVKALLEKDIEQLEHMRAKYGHEFSSIGSAGPLKR